MSRRLCGMLAAGCLLAYEGVASAQSVTLPTPNMTALETAPVGDLMFTFTHRFWMSGPKVINSPTFLLETGITDWSSVAVRYATNSIIGGRVNEWEPSLRLEVLPRSPFRLSTIGAYNTAAESVDGALLAGYDIGALSLRGSARAFSSGYGAAGSTLAVGGGVIWQLTRFLGIAADLGGVVAAQNVAAVPTLQPAWSAGVQFQIPFSPHAVNLYATNANTMTLQGMSMGTATVRYGFDFVVPFRSLARWRAIFDPPQVGS